MKKWISHDGSLCLHGYPIRIIGPGPNEFPFGLEHDGRVTSGYMTLAMAKSDGKRPAEEIDEFEPVA